MIKNVVVVLFIFCLSCALQKHPNVRVDLVSDFLNHPIKFNNMVIPVRYWHFENNLVHFITNSNEFKNPEIPTIYVHGLGGSLEDFSELIELKHYGKLKKPFYALDLPGFGKSFTYESELNIKKYSEVLREFISMTDSQTVNLVCHSMGGQICIEYALAYPDHINLLTLIDPAGVYERSQFIKTIVHHNAGINIGSISHPRTKSLSDLSWYSQSFTRKIITNDPKILMAIESYKENFHSRISLLQVKTLIIWGKEDAIFNFENGLFLKENIAKSNLYIIEGADHTPQKSHADFISKLIEKYL